MIAPPFLFSEIEGWGFRFCDFDAQERSERPIRFRPEKLQADSTDQTAVAHKD
jgi:hypothetical protein